MSLLSELKADLAKYIAARDDILATGQTMTIDGQQFSKATFFRIEDQIAELRAQIAALSTGGMRAIPYRGGRS